MSLTEQNSTTQDESSLTLKYAEYQEAGALLQSWISDPDVSCPIQRSTLTLRELKSRNWHVLRYLDDVHSTIRDIAPLLDLPASGLYQKFELHRSLTGDAWLGVISNWRGRTRPGVIIIEDIMRTKGSGDPWISEITKAVYEKKHSIESLKSVFVLMVINENTKLFVKEQLYTAKNGLHWPDESFRVWEFGTPEYQALLGTRIGKVVAYLVLGAFERGTRQIDSITTWSFPPCNTLQMRFNIEEVG